MERLYYVFCYVKHFLRANSRHGTHSPFVYDLTEVIYKRAASKEGGRTSDMLINQIAAYHGVACVTTPINEGRDKALMLSWADVDRLAVLQHQFRYLIVRDIYRGRVNRQCWRALQADRRFVVCIDLFYFGLIFYRTAQPKQNFRLRFPFWKGWF